MDILYLTLKNPNLSETGIYPDLVHALVRAGHKVTICFADSPKNTPVTTMTVEYGVRILKVNVGEMFGVNFIKKGINTLRVEGRMTQAIDEYLSQEHFDMVLYATPPVTFAKVVDYCKSTFHCMAFLMLKDIFPQNAVDIGLFRKNGPLYFFFRNKERNLYELSDMIGCMSEANRTYLMEHNPTIPKDQVILFPNTIRVPAFNERQFEAFYSNVNRKLRFVFGGNMGKPQAIDYLMDVILYEESPAYPYVEFIFVGNGSESDYVKQICAECDNATFIDYLPPEEYNELMDNCDVGIVSLDARFTIPNYPSRMLGYMSMAKPMIACTDDVTDVKELLTEQAKCGLWCRSDDISGFWACVEILLDSEVRKILGLNGRRYLEKYFDVRRSVKLLEASATVCLGKR